MKAHTPEEEEKIQNVINRLGRSHPWLEKYAESLECTYEELMARAEDWLRNDEWWIEGGRFEGISIPHEFWEHYQDVTNSVVPEDKQQNFFSCSC